MFDGELYERIRLMSQGRSQKRLDLITKSIWVLRIIISRSKLMSAIVKQTYGLMSFKILTRVSV